MPLAHAQRAQLEDVLLKFTDDMTNKHPHTYIQFKDEALDKIEEILNDIP